MADVSPQIMARRLRAFASGTGEGSLSGTLEAVARSGAKVWASSSIGTFMRDAKGGGRRSPTDRGPIRILTGTLAKAVRGPHGRSGAIETVTTSGRTVTLTKGVLLSVAKGGYNEGRTAKSGRDLSFLRPGLDASKDQIVSLARKRVRAATRRALQV
jgi:hypothetical protein